MRYFKRQWTLLTSALLAVACLSSPAYAGLIVIANPHFPVNHLSKSEISSIYLGNTTAVKGVSRVVPIDQGSSSIPYQQFYQAMLGWSAGQVADYWSQQTFTGGGQEPNAVTSDAAAIQAVSQTPGAMAYIESNSLRAQGGRVKVLYGNMPDSSPGQNYFPSMNQQDNAQQQRYVTRNTPRVSQPETTMPAQAQTQPQATVMPLNTKAVQFAQNGSENVWHAITANFHLDDTVNNSAVQSQVLWFLSHRAVLNRMLSNAKPYLGYVFEQTQSRHMPAEFALLPMVESGYDPLAYSHAGAAGLWQMMPGTASSYGLDINWWYDGRADLLSSTNAALDYIVRLHSNMNSWYLAAAAYNAGQGTVDAAMHYNERAGHPTNFWQLPLPNETRAYVPRLLALAVIVKHADKYHVQLPYIPVTPYFTAVTLHSQLDLAEVARLSETSVAMIHQLNPGLRRWASNPDGTYNLLIPATKLSVFNRDLSKLSGHSHISWQYHEVRPTETLQKIARNYHTNVALLKRVNKMQTSALSPNQGILVPLYLNHKYPNLKTQKVEPLLAAANTKSAPISKADNLKTLLGKIYGSN